MGVVGADPTPEQLGVEDGAVRGTGLAFVGHSVVLIVGRACCALFGGGVVVLIGCAVLAFVGGGVEILGCSAALAFL